MSAEVVVVPAMVMCPSCAMVLHTTTVLPSHMPPPAAMGFRCLNSRCEEYRVVKLVPLQRVNTEVPDGHDG